MTMFNKSRMAHRPPEGLKYCARFDMTRMALSSLIWVSVILGARAAEPSVRTSLLQDLKTFNTLGTVLYIAAHPDDENTQLITYLARGRGYRTAYLSLTRGDGGQNEIGPEFDEKLGVARTQELLAARRLDGGRQFFTRAIDFGYSKSPEETLRFWDREQVLGDVVRVIRTFRPDVIVTRFPIPPGSGGHGHHTASGILGVEALALAGDPRAYPEQLTQELTPWQPKRVLWNGGGGGRGAGALNNATIRVDIGGADPVTGEGFGAIASRSRGLHITQGFGGFGGRGGGSGPNVQTFMHMGGEPATNDLMDGIDTTWARVPGGTEIGSLTEKLIGDFKPENPAASLPALLEIRASLARLPSDPLVNDKRLELDRILQACLGLGVSTRSPQPEVQPGQSFKFVASVSVSNVVPVTWRETRIRSTAEIFAVGSTLRTGHEERKEITCNVPKDMLITHPYWLRSEGQSGLSRVDDPKLIGTPENEPAFPIEHVFEVGGQTLVVTDEPLFFADTAEAKRRRVDVVPPASIRFLADVSLFRPEAAKSVAIEVTASLGGVSGRLEFSAPESWKVSPASRPFQLAAAGAKTVLTFEVSAPPTTSSVKASARVQVGGRRYSHQRVEINYSHLPFMLLQPAAQARLVSLDLATRGRAVGYVPGAGDATAQALEQLGYAVTTLTGAELIPEKLAPLDAVVIGVRAFNERRDLAPNLTNLFAFVENGGTVVVQYNRPGGAGTQAMGPYPLSIQGPAPQLRVTDETVPVKFLAPDHPALTTPNRIGDTDFEGWFQERGAYFPSSWDKERYTPILAMSDPGEPPLESSVLIARHGKGHYVYTGLAFFRQLPAGVPGAYRLFANLVSLGR